MSMKLVGGVALCAALVLAAGAAARPFDGGPGGSDGHPRGGPGHGRGAWFNNVCDTSLPGDASCSSLVVTDANGAPLASASPPSECVRAGAVPRRVQPDADGLDGDDRDRRRVRRSERRERPRRVQRPVRAAALHDGERLLPQGQPERAGRAIRASNSGWALEISLDVQTAHAICQNCKILLVEASSASIANLGTAVNEAASLGATVVSNSYGGGEYSSETSDESAYFNHPGVAITVSSGDSGYGVEFPAASQYVTAVGGTTLNVGAGNTYGGETVWSGAGSGCSTYDDEAVLADGHRLHAAHGRRRGGRRRSEHRRRRVRLRHVPGPERLVPGRRHEPGGAADRAPSTRSPATPR